MAGTGACPDPWAEGHHGTRVTTVTDLDLTSCLTRLQILMALGQGRLDVSHVASAAEISVNLASGHLARLAKAGMVEFERQGGHHVYRLAVGTRVEHDSDGAHVTVAASDGCRAGVHVPWSSPVGRVLRSGLAPFVTIKAAPVPAPSPGARSSSRRPSGPG